MSWRWTNVRCSSIEQAYHRMAATQIAHRPDYLPWYHLPPMFSSLYFFISFDNESSIRLRSSAADVG